MVQIINLYLTMINQCIVIVAIFSLVNGQLIRPNNVYLNIIKGVCSHYECDSITFIYKITNNTESQEITSSTNLKNLQLEINEFYKQTAIIDVRELVALIKRFRVLSNIRRSLFVFLNVSTDMKAHITGLLDPLLAIFKPIWLIFFKDNTMVADFLKSLYIPFDTKFMVSERYAFGQEIEIVTELYQIGRGTELRSEIFTIWGSNIQIRLPDLSLYKRRNNLYGHLLRVAVMNDPFCHIHYMKDGEIELSGMFGKIMDILRRRLNFTISYQQVYAYGIMLKNNTWNGGVGALAYNRSDIFAGTLRMTIDRQQVIDFTMPIYREKFRMFIKKSSKLLTWNKFLKPFKNEVWYVICFLILLSSITLTLMQSLSQIQYSKKYGIKKELWRFSDTIFSVLGALCNQVMEESLLNPIRISQFMIHMTSFVVLAAYSAILISSLTVYTFDPPFTSLKGLLNTRSYRMGLIKDSSEYSFFQKSTNYLIKSVFRKIISKETFSPLNNTDGFKRVCNKKSYLFLTAQSIASQFYMKGCTLMPLDTVITSSMAMGLQQYSPFRDLINGQILLMKESGLQRKSMAVALELTDKDEEPWTPVEFIDIIPLLTLLAGGSCLCMIILVGEILVNQKLITRTVHMIYQRLKRHKKTHCTVLKINNK